MLTTRRAMSIALMGAALLCSTGRPVAAQSGPALSIKFAIDPSIGGTMYEGFSGTVNGVPAVIESGSWTDTHSSTAPLFVGGVDFPLAGLVRSLFNVEYGRANASTLTIGTVGSAQVRAEFDPYEFFGVETGVRVGAARGVYGIATIGFRRVSAIRITATTSAAGSLGIQDFYDASNVPTYGFGGGYSFGSVAFEAMAKYAGALDAAGPTASLLPGGLASAGERWSLPVSIVVRF